MFTRHVTRQLTAYLHEELDSAQARRVAAHLAICPRCRAELDALRRGEELAAHLPLCAAPDRIWTHVEAALPSATATPAPIHLPVGRFKSARRLRIAVGALLAGGLVLGGY